MSLKLTKAQQAVVDFIKNCPDTACRKNQLGFARPTTLKSLKKKGIIEMQGKTVRLVQVRRTTVKAKIVEAKTETESKKDALPLIPIDSAILVVRAGGKVSALYGPFATFARDMQPVPHVNRHSPDGFEFGYEGSGPADLALSILMLVFGSYWADLYYQKFKREIVATKTEQQWGMRVSEIVEWFTNSSRHEWFRREIRAGHDKGAVLPIRCRKCGQIQRPDGKNGPCTRGGEVCQKPNSTSSKTEGQS